MERQRFIKGKIKNITFRSIAALLAAVLLAVSIPFTSFADPVNAEGNEISNTGDGTTPDETNDANGVLDLDAEINVVLLPQGFGRISGMSDSFDENKLFASESKTMVTLGSLLSQCLYSAIYPGYDISPKILRATDITGSHVFEQDEVGSTIIHPDTAIRGYDFYRINFSNAAKAHITDTYANKKYAVIAIEMMQFPDYSGKSRGARSETADKDGKVTSRTYPMGNPNADGYSYSDNYVYNANNALSGAVITAAYPHDAGTTSGDTQSYTTQATTITATPKGDYVFDHWEKNGTPIGGKASMEVLCDGAIDAYVAVFKPKAEAKGVHVFNNTKNQSEEPVGGKVTGDKSYEGTDTSTVIRAIPDSGWNFDHWECSIGGDASRKIVSYSKEYTAPVTNSVDNYYAYFTQEPQTKGVHVLNDTRDQDGKLVGGTVAGNKVYEGTDTSTVIRAIPDSGWYFDHWECSIGGDASRKIVSYSKEYTAPVTNSVDNYYAYFTKEPNGVYTFVSDESHNPVTNGTVSGDAFRNNNGQLTYQTTITATAKKGYVFDHWDLQDASAEGVYREVSKDSTITVKVNDKVDKYYAVFIPMWDVKTSIALREADGFIHASTIPGVTSGDTEGYVNGQEVKQTTLQAYAKDDQFVFEHWEFASTDQNEEPESGYYTTVSDRNPYTVNIVKPGNSVRIHQYYRAVFDYMWGVSTRITVKGADGSIAPSDIGYTTGDTDGYVNGQEVKQTTLQAYAKDSSFVFDHWELATVIGREDPRDSDYKRVSDSNPINVPITRESGKRKVYRAVFVKKGTAYGVYTASCDESHNPASYGTVSGDALRNNNGQLTYQTTITATAKKGYVFDHWDLQDSQDSTQFKEVSKDSTITVKVNDAVERYYAVFIPMWGVKATVSNAEAGTVSGGTDGYVNGQEIKQTTLQAYAKDSNYVFDHWEVGESTKDTAPTSYTTVSNSNPINVPVKRESGKYKYYKAVFVEKGTAFGVYTEASNPEYGTTSGDALRNTNGQLTYQTTITATAKNGYIFDHWELNGDISFKSSSNPMTVKVNDKKEVYVAVFKPKKDAKGVHVFNRTGIDDGNPDPNEPNTTGGVVSGEKSYEGTDTSTVIRAIPAEGWYFDHWECSIGGDTSKKIVSYSKEYTAPVTNSVDKYYAYFSRDDQTKGVHVYAKNESGGADGGTVTGDKAYEGTDTSTVIRAIPQSGWYFDHWECSINGEEKKIVSYSKEYTAPVTKSVDNYYAYFTNIPDTIKGVHVYCNNGGSVSGEKLYEGTDTSTVIRAIPQSGWYFDHWECSINGGPMETVSYSKEYTVSVTKSVDKYRACFTKEPYGVFTKASNELHEPVAYGTVSGDAFRNNNGQLTYQTTITATAKKGYVFDHWDLQDYHEPTKFTEISKDSTITVKVNDAVERYYAVFIPMWGVKATVNNTEAGTVSGGTDGYVNGQEIKQTTLQAYAKDSNYVFDHWEVGESTKDTAPTSYTTVSNSNPINVPVKRESGKYKYYKAVFVEKDSANGVYTTACDVSHNPASYGTVSGDALRNNNGQLAYQTTITATAKKGYVFDHWDLQDYQDSTQFKEVSKDSTITVKVNDNPDKYYAVFIPMWDVKTQVKPEGAATTTGDTDGYVNGQEIRQTTLQAYVKNTNYVFDHWELATVEGSGEPADSDYSKVSASNPYTVEIERKAGTHKYYRAVYLAKGTANGVYTEASNPAFGTTSGDALRNNNGQIVNQTTIAASAKRGYVFDHWELGSVEVSKDSTLTVKVQDSVDKYIAVFVPMWGVKTSASPIEAGYTSGDTDGFVNGQEVKQTTIQATLKSDEYVFSHWELKDGSIVSNSISVTVPIKREDGMVEYVAVFEKVSDAFGVTTQPDDSDHGSTTGDTLRKKDGQLIDQTTIQAIPASNEWVFDYWLLSTNGGEAKKVSNANPYNVKVKDQHDVYTAVFVSAFAADGVYTTVSDQQCGTTSGDSLRNINGQVVSQTTIEAFPSSNEWIFDYWELRIPGESPVKVSIANPYTVAVDDCVYIYTAYFRARNGKTNPEIEIKGHATGITDSVIKKKERLFTVPVLGVDRNYILQLAEQAVQESSSRNDIPPYAGDSPRLSALSAALQLQERKNEEELKDTGFDFVTSDGEIITISDVPVTSAVTDAAGSVVEDKYGDIYKSEVIKVSETIVPVTFNDGKRTVIWSNTGAQEDDRLLIIQQGMMFADRNITPIADKDGNIVFSTSDFNGSRFILIKVGYK